MAIRFGPKPRRIDVTLAEDADWVKWFRVPEISPSTGEPLEAWPPQTQIEMRWVFGDGTRDVWPASFDPDDPRKFGWHVDKEVSNPMLTKLRSGLIASARWFADDQYMGVGVPRDVTAG